MQFKNPALWLSAVCFASCGAFVVATFTRAPAARAASEAAAPSATAFENAPVDPTAIALLDVAFEAAALLPENPHAKNRARNQGAVVDTLLALDQPGRAAGRAEEMTTWRRGQAYAELACYAARRALRGEAERMLERARVDAERAKALALQEDAKSQGWQHDRIQAKLALACELLGDAERARAFAAASSDAERARIAEQFPAPAGDAEFDARIAELDRAIAAGSFELVEGAMRAAAKTYARVRADEVKRTSFDERFTRAWKSMPLEVRIDLELALARAASDAGDVESARVFVEEARACYDGARWAPQDYVVLGARIAAERHRAGDGARAKEELDALHARFDVERDGIVDIYRAKALRALAEASGVLGDEAAQARDYARAVEEGVANPNGRPRVDDLVATCCSMATARFVPTAELLERIRAIRAGLKAPW